MNKNDILEKYWNIEMDCINYNDRYIEYWYEKWDLFIWCELRNQYLDEIDEIKKEIETINVSNMKDDTHFLVIKNNKII